MLITARRGYERPYLRPITSLSITYLVIVSSSRLQPLHDSPIDPPVEADVPFVVVLPSSISDCR